MSIIEVMAFKTRQQKLFYDIYDFGYFFVALCSNVGTALTLIVISFSFYTFIVYKSQQTIKILLPLAEQEMFEIFLYVAMALKVIE